MEWVKSQISSPEGDEFKETTSYPVETESSFAVFEAPRLEMETEVIIESSENTEPEVFSLPGHYWGSLNSDKELKDEIQRVINDEVQRRVKLYISDEIDPLKKSVIESSKQEGHIQGYSLGLEQGYAEGREKGAYLWRQAQLSLSEKVRDLRKAKEDVEVGRTEQQKDFYERLDGLCSIFLKEKQNLLSEHEVLWSRAMVQLLKRFLIKNSLEVGREIENWLHETVADFASTQKVQIFLNQADYQKSQPLLSKNIQSSFEVFCDPNLKSGDCRYECQGGGAIFSAEKEIERLEKMIESSVVEKGLQCN